MHEKSIALGQGLGDFMMPLYVLLKTAIDRMRNVNTTRTNDVEVLARTYFVSYTPNSKLFFAQLLVTAKKLLFKILNYSSQVSFGKIKIDK